MVPQQADFPTIGLVWGAILLWRLIAALSGASKRDNPRVLDMRLRLEHVTGEHKYDIFRVEVKGVLFTPRPEELRITTSCLDVTEVGPDGRRASQPVLCLDEQHQEPDSICYQDLCDLGRVERDASFAEWTTVGNLVPEALVTPVSGRRKVAVVLYLHAKGESVKIRHGFVVAGVPLLTLAHEFEWEVKHEGYKTREERGRRAEGAVMRLAMAFACADGPIRPGASAAIEAWKESLVSAENEPERAPRRAELEQYGAEALTRATNGGLSIGDSLLQLKQEQAAQLNVQAMALCLEIVVANGSVNPDGLRAVRRAAVELEVDPVLFRGMEEHRLSGLIVRAQGPDELQLLLGVDPEWSSEQARRHLTELYERWNARVEAAREDEQRQVAERMLERIAQARQGIADRS